MMSRLLTLLVLVAPLVAAQRPRPISLEGCGYTKGCFTIPDGCHLGPRGQGDCDGIYIQEIEPGNRNNVKIQLVARNVAGWVAVGFNSMPHMNGTDVVACQANAEGHVTVKNLHNVNHTNVMDDPNDVAPYLYDAVGEMREGSISCQFDRPLVTENEQFDVNLNLNHYIIFAWNYNGTAPADGPLLHMHQAKPIITNTTHSAHDHFFNNLIVIDLSGCGKTKGCSRAPAGCPSADKCEYVFTQQVSPHDPAVVEFELAGQALGWVAAGYNFNYTMNGTDVIGCQLTPERDHVAVKKLHNVNHTNIIDAVHNATMGLLHSAARVMNERIYCRFARTIKPIEGDPYSRDLSKKSYIIIAANANATAPPDQALGHKHSYPPIILKDMFSATDSEFNYNASAESPDYPLNYEPAVQDLPQAIDLTGCGETKGCSRAPAGCASADECFYVFTQKADAAAGTVTYELSAMAAGWVAVGFNTNFTMNGTDVHACQLAPDNEQVVVKKVHNVNFTNVADDADNIAVGMTNAGGAFANNRIQCSFTRSIKPIAGDITSRDLALNHTFILTGNVNGTAPAKDPLTHKHNIEPMGLPLMLTAMDSTFNFNASAERPDYPMNYMPNRPVGPKPEEPIDLTTCGKTKGCSRAPAGCATADECFYVFTQQPDTKKGTVTYELSGQAAGWIAVGFNTNFTMNGTDVHACQLTKKGDRVKVKKVHNVNFTNVLDSETNISIGLKEVSSGFNNSRIHCRFTRPIKPIAGDPTSHDLSLNHTIIIAGNVNGTAPAKGPLMHKHNIEPRGLPIKLSAMDTAFNFNASATDKHQLRRAQPVV